jgi:TM2 domain-containing membrane protein YozV
MRYLLVLLSLFLLMERARSQDLFDRQHSVRYAEHLVESKQHDKGFNELERIRFAFGLNDTIASLILRNSFSSRNLIKGKQLLNRYSPADDKLKFGLTKLYILSGDSITHLTVADVRATQLFSFYNYFKVPGKDKLEHATALNRSMMDHPSFILTRKMLDNYHRKSPVVAGLLSIIPGMGKIYAGRKADGLISLAFISTTGFITYRMFSKGGITSSPGWIYGFLSCGFYIGNIYGGQNAARQYNKKLKAEYDRIFESDFINYTP